MHPVAMLIISGTAMFAVIGGLSMLAHYYTLDGIKSRTVGDGQYGTARFATEKEIKEAYAQVPYAPKLWRKGISLPTVQGLVVGCKTIQGKTIALVDQDDVHTLMIGAAGVGKTAFFLYPNLEYACASGMSFLTTDTKGDLFRNYAGIAKEYYGYEVAVIDLRNKKRFKSDLLQRSYQQMADQFGISKRDAANAVVELEKLGVIRRVFRTLCINGQQVPNVLFLELDVNMLESLTFPCREYHSNQQDILTEVVEPPTEVSDTSVQKEEEPVTEMSETNTGITNKDYNIEYPIQSYQEVERAFKEQIEYDILKYDMPDQSERDELITVAVDVLTSSSKTIRVNSEDRYTELVKKQFQKLNMLHIQYVLHCLQQNGSKARNIRAVMITALYDAVGTMGFYYDNLYQCDRMKNF